MRLATEMKVVSVEHIAHLGLGPRTIVLAHGVFDILHPGHVAHLREAKALGDYLVVSVTSDQYVNKGPGRPVYSQAVRMAQVAALEYVDYVVLSDHATGCEVIHAIKPAIVVKGSDYQGVHIPEMEAVAEYGGHVVTTASPHEDIRERIEQARDSHYPVATEVWLAEFRRRYSCGQVLDALEAPRQLTVLLVGEYIQDRYTLVDTLSKSPREHHLSVRFLEQHNYPGGIVAIRRHLEPHVATACVVTQREAIVKERFVVRNELRKLFSVQRLPDSISISAAGRRQIEVCGNYDLVMVADYGHGLVTPELRRILEEHARFLAVVCQTNSANYGFNLASKWQRFDYLCLDGPELALAESAGFHLNQKVMVTRGASGASFQGHDCPALATKVLDRVGAGDALFAVSAPLVAAGVDSALALFIGSCAAAMQCETLGNKRSVDKAGLRQFMSRLLS